MTASGAIVGAAFVPSKPLWQRLASTTVVISVQPVNIPVPLVYTVVKARLGLVVSAEITTVVHVA